LDWIDCWIQKYYACCVVACVSSEVLYTQQMMSALLAFVLQYLADIPAEKLVECHGHFRTASCIQCGKPADAAAVKETIVQHGKAPVCQRQRCGGYVKPDIVFFGEGLPQKFHNSLRKDLLQADMVLILGTSLQVAPVSMIPDSVSDECKRVLLNRELVGDLDLEDGSSDRDVFYAGDCDDTILKLAALLGWQEDLQEWNARVQGGSIPADSSETAQR
jgi:NAD-dependent SIR2 family protein deacetylase